MIFGRLFLHVFVYDMYNVYGVIEFIVLISENINFIYIIYIIKKIATNKIHTQEKFEKNLNNKITLDLYQF